MGGYWSVKSKFGLDGKSIVLGVAAIWDWRKGLDDFLKISQELDRDYQIILVGPTQAQIKKLPENIIGINRTDSVAELAQLYAIADIFVNPTYEDNYPTTNIEAIACGTPAITYDTGGSGESAEMYGVSVAQGDMAALIHSMNDIESRLLQLDVACSKLDKKNSVNKYLSNYIP